MTRARAANARSVSISCVSDWQWLRRLRAGAPSGDEKRDRDRGWTHRENTMPIPNYQGSTPNHSQLGVVGSVPFGVIENDLKLPEVGCSEE